MIAPAYTITCTVKDTYDTGNTITTAVAVVSHPPEMVSLDGPVVASPGAPKTFKAEAEALYAGH